MLLRHLQEVDMEAEFLSLGMDIIGLGVFNYDFRSLTSESPVIKVRHMPSCCLFEYCFGVELDIFSCYFDMLPQRHPLAG